MRRLFLHSRSTATLSLVPYRMKAFVVLPIIEQRMLLYQGFNKDSTLSSWHADVPSTMKPITIADAVLGQFTTERLAQKVQKMFNYPYKDKIL